jgi:iron complex transport system ATP-binding protein
MESALELENVSVRRDGKYILKNVTMTIRKGENVAVIGPNGSGKTTLIKLLRGDILPYYDEDKPGRIRIFGRDRWNIFDIRGKMGVVSMDLQNRFRPDTTSFEVICSGFFSSMDIFRNMQVTPEMASAARSAAVMMGVEDVLDRAIENLSLGEMRRVLIARAMATSPDLLVLDEPMTGLDIVMKSKFRAMFDILMARGVSIAMITHDLTDIPESMGRIIMIKGGEVFCDGRKEDLLTDA